MQLRDFAEKVLLGDQWPDKLLVPDSFEDTEQTTRHAVPPLPGRPPEVGFGHQSKERPPFPKEHELRDPKARGIVLHFFANHELLALELMALALLKFPEAPAAFRLGIARTMLEEQKHLQLYIGRMKELGVTFGDVPVNDFFWQCLRGMQTPEDYVTGMSLTFEQANLDYSLYYRDLFRGLGDHATAEIMDQVYREEIGHVKHGVVWFERWRPHKHSFWQEYEESLHLPLSPARARGLAFAAEGRREAGLDDDFVRQMLAYSGSRGALPRILWFNSDCEIEWATRSPGYRPPDAIRSLLADFGTVPMFLARESDIVLCERPPSVNFRLAMKDLGFKVPEFFQGDGDHRDSLAPLVQRKVESFEPWGWSRRAARLAVYLVGPREEVRDRCPIPDIEDQSFVEIFDKTKLPALRQEFRRQYSQYQNVLMDEWLDGELAHTYERVEESVRKLSGMGVTAVIKVPFSAAGQGLIRIRPNEVISEVHQGKIKRTIKDHGRVLVEPWLERLFDMSILINVQPEQKNTLMGVTRFLTDARGQYFGHILGEPMFGMGDSTRALLIKQVGGDKSLRQMVQDGAQHCATWLRQRGFCGRAGIDMFWFRHPLSPERIGLRLLNEINARNTMGHLALGLAQHLAPGIPGVWRALNKNQLQSRGLTSFEELAKGWQRAFPPKLAEGVKGKRIAKGIFFTNDPEHATMSVGVVAAGLDAIQFLERQEPKQSPYSRVFVDLREEDFS